MDFVDPSVVTGSAPAATGTTLTVPGGSFVDPTVVTGQPASTKSWWESTYDKVKETVKPYLATPEESTRRLRSIAGSFAQLADMSTGIGAGVARAALFANATPVFIAMGASPKEAAVAVKRLGEKIPEEIAAPFGKIAKALGQEEAYHNNPIGWAMGKMSEGIIVGGAAGERKLGVPAEMIESAADSLMTGLGLFGVRAAYKSHTKHYANAGHQAELARGAAVNQRAATRDSATTQADVAAIAERDAALGEMTAGPKELRAIIKEAKQNRVPGEEVRGEIAVTELFNKARQNKALTPEEAVAESQARIATTKPHIRLKLTPELAASMTRLTEADPQIVSKLQEGKTTQNDMEILAGIATGAAVSPFVLAEMYDYLNPNSTEDGRYKFKKMLGTWMDGRSEAERMLPDDLRRLDENQTPRRRINEPGDYPETPRPKLWDGTVDAGAAVGVGAAGMVLGKKGMPHPEMVSRLANPLKDRIAGLPVNGVTPDGTLASNWADKAISRWLQKPTNEIADVEIPFGEGTKKLGEVMDTVLASKLPHQYGPAFKESLKNVPADEPVWDIRIRTADAERNALTSYLSHVGDYLRQNVAPEKLGQYDFVRAVRETAKNDARMAAEMEKAATASMKDLPVYKDYGDGMKWVELKLPEKLTEEQAKGVRKGTDGNSAYIAIDLQGKDITNSYTGDKARGRTPQEAHLAGRLAEEGNQMGHCVGGYCEGVAAGESRIFSLRDAKGRSHVTIEVEPKTSKKLAGSYGQEIETALGLAQLADKFRAKMAAPDNILQIKGKQNRAPNAEYLPYVQDFVRQGPDGSPAKWGEVGDLENTGLTHIKHEMNGPWGSLKEGFYTKDEFNKATGINIKDNPLGAQEGGAADPELLAKIAAGSTGATLGAYLGGDDNRGKGALIGGAAGLAATMLPRGKGTFIEGVDYTLGRTSTIIGHIDPEMRLLARNHDRLVARKTEEAYAKIHPFFEAAEKLSPIEFAALDKAYIDNKVASSPVLRAHPELAAGYRQVRELLDDFQTQFKSLHRFKEGLTEYLPRVVIDPKGLLATMDKTQQSGLEKVLLKAEAQMLRTRERSLSDVEQSLIVDNYLKSPAATSHLPSYAKARGIKDVTAEQRPFYASMKDSLGRYVSAAVKDIEAAKFFGKDLVTTKEGGKEFTNVGKSVGQLVSKKLDAGTITSDQAVQLKKVLQDRFGAGEESPSGFFQDFRNLNNITLLGSLEAAATQLGDISSIWYHHSWKAPLEAVVMKVTGKGIDPADFGLANHIMEEMGNGRLTGKALMLNFKANRFATIDQFAKGLHLTASWAKNRALVRTEKGTAQLAQKWEAAYGDDFPQLVQELRSGKRTDLVDSLLWSELADAQPISKFEMSPEYNAHPNGRILGQMKTYMQTQADVIRRDVYDELRKGNIKQAVKNATAFAVVLSLGGIPSDVIKDWISGRDFDFSKINYVENFLRNFGLNRYASDRMEKGQPLEVLRDMMVPPFKQYQDIAGMDEKSVKSAPVVGKAVYNRFLGGNEKEEIRKLRQEKLEENKKDPAWVERRERMKERKTDAAWRDYYLERARGNNPTRPSN